MTHEKNRRDRLIEAIDDGAVYGYSLGSLIEDFKATVILATVEASDSIRAAAEDLEISPRTIYAIRKRNSAEIRSYGDRVDPKPEFKILSWADQHPPK